MYHKKVKAMKKIQFKLIQVYKKSKEINTNKFKILVIRKPFQINQLENKFHLNPSLKLVKVQT